MKKGQLEMVGLTVIVIIMIIIFILFISLNRGKDTGTITAGESLYANNLLNAIMLYSLEKGSVSDYIQKCDEYTNSINRDEAKINEYCIEDDIIGLIKPLLRANQKYEMLFSGECGEMTDIYPGECGDNFITASPYYIRTSGTCKISLKLC